MTKLDTILDQVMLPPEAAVATSRESLGAMFMQMAYDGFDWDVVGKVWFVVGVDGLAAVHMGQVSEADFVRRYTQKLGKVLAKNPAFTDMVKAQLKAYLTGTSAAFDVPIDWSQMSPFQAQVLRAAQAIPFGTVATYGEVAKAIGKPQSARAVGRALGTNPMPIVIPCHRVVASDGKLTGYIGGIEAKAELLRLEGYLLA